MYVGVGLELRKYGLIKNNRSLIILNIFSASSEGHWKIVKWLITHCGADVEAADNSGSTSLHVAAHNGQENVIHVLVKW